MEKNTVKLIFISLLLFNFFLLIMTPGFVLADNGAKQTNYGLDITVGDQGPKELKTNKSITEIAGSVINYVLGIVGTIFLLVILVGGYKWMTSGGNDEKVAEGKKMIIAGINGMIVIFLAYALAYVIIQGLQGATTATPAK